MLCDICHKNIATVHLTEIVNDKVENGDYFSFEEFYTRNSFKGSKVNKSHIENLILCGAFDKIENIDVVSKRRFLIEAYRKIYQYLICKELDRHLLQYAQRTAQASRVARRHGRVDLLRAV